LGYRRFILDGKEYRGHEFHYTQFLGKVPESITQVYDAKGNPVPTPVFRYKNVLASYTHLYGGEMRDDRRAMREEIRTSKNECLAVSPQGQLLRPREKDLHKDRR
jgi:cobyrinic acid a,c-diamide synthase